MCGVAKCYLGILCSDASSREAPAGWQCSEVRCTIPTACCAAAERTHAWRPGQLAWTGHKSWNIAGPKCKKRVHSTLVPNTRAGSGLHPCCVCGVHRACENTQKSSIGNGHHTMRQRERRAQKARCWQHKCPDASQQPLLAVDGYVNKFRHQTRATADAHRRRRKLFFGTMVQFGQTSTQTNSAAVVAAYVMTHHGAHTRNMAALCQHIGRQANQQHQRFELGSAWLGGAHAHTA